MITKTACQNCNQNIEFELENAGTLVACPHCGNQTELNGPAKPVSKPEPFFNRFPKAEVPAAALPVAQYLGSIRAATSYPSLRSAINICWVITIGFAGLAVIVAWTMVFAVSRRTGDMNLGEAVLVTISAAVVIGLSCVIRDFIFLFVDIADSLLHYNSRGIK